MKFDIMFSNHGTKVRHLFNICNFLMLNPVKEIAFIWYLQYFSYLCTKNEEYGERKNGHSLGDKR